jgi:ABC-2 type transport system ATP-binding protein
MELLVNDISKSIKQKRILSHITLQLQSTSIYGFIGSNGSGKTMLFRALSGLMSVDSGSILLDGKVLRKDFSVLPSLGIILENAGLYPSLTGMENLRYLAKLKGKIKDQEIREAILRVGLDPNDRRTYKKYSLGMKQRLAIAQAVMEKPDIIMLDEPTNSLDDEGIKRIRNVILEEKKRGALILVASHNKEDIRIMADQLYQMKEGEISLIEKESAQ